MLFSILSILFPIVSLLMLLNILPFLEWSVSTVIYLIIQFLISICFFCFIVTLENNSFISIFLKLNCVIRIYVGRKKIKMPNYFQCLFGFNTVIMRYKYFSISVNMNDILYKKKIKNCYKYRIVKKPLKFSYGNVPDNWYYSDEYLPKEIWDLLNNKFTKYMSFDEAMNIFIENGIKMTAYWKHSGI